LAENMTSLNVHLTRAMRERARDAAKRLGKPTGQLIKDALDEKLIALDARFRQEDAQREADRLAKKAKHDPALRQGLRGIGSSSLPLTTQVRTSLVAASPEQDPMEALYIELAKSILAAGNDNEEVRKRVVRAIAAVRRERPLTAPPEGRILETLEVYMLKLREEGVEPVRTVDSFVGSVLDVSKLKTSGFTE